MPQSYPRLPLELVERICEDATAGEYDSSVEQLGKSVSLVCREWKEVGQALAFKQPVLGRWYSDHRDDLTVLAEHLERFPHLARLVRVLKVKFGWDATDAALPPLHQLLERCRNLTEIACTDKPQLLLPAIPLFPCATLTSLSLHCTSCLQLRHLTLRAVNLPAHPGAPISAPSGVAALSLRTLTLEFNGYNNQRPLRPPPSFAPIEAIFLQRFFRLIEPTTLTSLAISFHTRNFGGVSKWISTCVNLRSLVAWMQDGDLTPYTSRLTSMLGPLRSLRRLKLYGDKSVQLCENMSEREENLHAFTLAAFLDSLPTTLVMFNIAIWAPAGDCCGVVKAFLRCRLYGSPLVSASIDSAAGRWARISITATKQRLTYQDGRRRRTWSNVGEGEGTIRRAAPPSELACEPAEDPWPFAALRRERISARWLMSYRYWAGYCETCYESDDGSWELDRGQQDRSWWWRDPEKERL
ncbi:cell wall surface anchor family protein, partial [Rhodotorula toruloides]